MSDLFGKLGIDWKLLIFQIINFLILLWVLKRYAYKPILKALDGRTKRIEKSIEDAKRIEQQAGELAADKERTLNQARAEAGQIVAAAQRDAAGYMQRMKDQSQAETAAILVSTKQEVAAMKEMIVAEAKDDLAELVVAATEKVIRVKLDPAVDRKLIVQALTAAGKKT